MVVLGGFGIRAGSRFRSAILADLAMRGLAISFLTLARVESSGFFLRFLYDMPDHDTRGEAIQFHFAQLRCGLVRKLNLMDHFDSVIEVSSIKKCAERDIFQPALGTESRLP